MTTRYLQGPTLPALKWMVAVMVFGVPGLCHASVTYFTSLATFNFAATTAVVEDFEAVSPKDTPLASFVSGGNTYVGLAGVPFPNVAVASPGYTNFGVPVTLSSILCANGDESFTVSFGAPTKALGFDTYLNSFGPATVQIFGASGLLDTHSHTHAANVVGFLGMIASENITSIRWTTVNGRTINTGIDNIRQGQAVIPEPTTLALFGLSLLGFCKRRRRQHE